MELLDEPIAPTKSEPDKLLEARQIGQKITSVIDDMSCFRDKDILVRVLLTNSSKAEISKKYNLSSAHFDRVKYRAKVRFMHGWDGMCSE